MLKKPTISLWKKLGIKRKFKNQRLKKIILKVASNPIWLFTSVIFAACLSASSRLMLSKMRLCRGYFSHIILASQNMPRQRLPSLRDIPTAAGKGRTNRGQCKPRISMAQWERGTVSLRWSALKSPVLPSEICSSAFKTNKFKVILFFLCRLIFCRYTIQLISWSEKQ